MKSRKINSTTTIITLMLCFLFFFSLLGCNRSVRSNQQSTNDIIQKLLPQAEQILIEGMEDRDPSIRTIAIEVIADTHQIKLMTKVIKHLNDPSVPVRFSASLAVGDTTYLLAKKDVSSLLNDKDENVRIAAAYALYKLSDAEKIEIIRKAIKNKDQTIRANATLLLGKCGDKNSINLLYWTMNDKDSDYKVEIQAAQSIAMLKDERIYSKLWTKLISAYADDKVMGIRAMGALATTDAKNDLVRMLDEEIAEVRIVAAEELGKLNDNIGEPVVLEALQQNLYKDMDEQDRQRILVLSTLAIGQIKSEKLIQYLPTLLEDPEKKVRIAAAKAVFLCVK
ncbi:MAG: HEAT repeat domain-containing protein [Planctomycetota bacterium]